MPTIIDELRALRYQGNKQGLRRGTMPVVQLTNDPKLWRGGQIFLSRH